MKNLMIYGISLIVSVLLIIPSIKCGCAFSNIFLSVGCSFFAAAIMAIFLEWANSKRVAKAKSMYFANLYNQLIMTFEKILWLNDRLKNTDFNWDESDNVYFSKNYVLAMSSKYKARTIKYADAIVELKNIGEKYTLEKVQSLPPNEQYKVNRLFQIVAANSSYLLAEVNAVLRDKLLLVTQEYMDVDKIEQMRFHISVSIGIMSKKDKNYQAAINFLIDVTNKLKKIGSYNNCVVIGSHGQMSMDEL